MLSLQTYRSIVASVALEGVYCALSDLTRLDELLVHLDGDAVRRLVCRLDRCATLRYALPPTACIWTRPTLLIQREGEGVLLSISEFVPFGPKLGAEETVALDFARRHWDSALITEHPAQIIALRLEHPAAEGPDTRRVDQAFIALGLERPLQEIWRSCPSDVACHEALEQSICFIRHGYAACRELIGHAFEEELFCAVCGCALDVRECRGCGATFPDNGAMSSGRGMLPRSLVEAFRVVGHVFDDEALEAAYQTLAA